METFWRTKGKRIAAWFMIALIVATTIPFGSIRASADDDTQNEKNAVAITETDADTNASYMEKKTLTDDQVSANTVDMGEIILTKEDTSYSVTAKGKNSDGADIEIAGTVEVKDNVVTAAPKEGYEITDVKVQKDNTDWKPDDAENDWWKSKLDESGAFKYEGFEDSTLDADYVFTIIFAKKQFTFTYTISQNGKLILNSGADNDKVEITAENENKDGKENVPYTNDEYKIKAAVTDTDYHLTSFKVDNEEQIAVDRIQNDLDECEYTFEKGITSSHSIEVTAVIDTCKVTIEKSGEGTIEINYAEESEMEVPVHTDVTIIITPGEDKQMTKLQVNGTEVTEEKITEREDGTLKYIISGVSVDTQISIEFQNIETEDLTALEEAGFQLLDENNQILTADKDGVYYAKTAILKSTDGKKIKLTSGTAGSDSIKLTHTEEINQIYKGGIFSKKKYVLVTVAKIVIDEDIPKIALTEAEQTIWKTETATTVDITGKAIDDNLKKVVWSGTQLTTDDEILKETQEAELNENGSFVIRSLPLAQNQNIDTIYLYAIDKVDQCSEAKIVTICRDSAAPQITEVSLIPADNVKQYVFGNYYNASVTLKVTAGDVNEKDGKTGYPAVGVQEIRVYSEDETKYYTGAVSSKVSGTDTASIEVLIPLEESAFAALKDVHIKAVDALGNVSEPYLLTQIENHNEITSDKLMLEKDAPEIQVVPQEDGKYEIKKDNITEYWYKEIPSIICRADDQKNGTDGSGLAERTVLVNGEELTAHTKNFIEKITADDEVVQKDSITLSAEDLQVMHEGANTVVTTYTDIAGNTTMESTKICLDTHKPEITAFQIEKKDASKILNILTFGNYGNGVIKVTVSADDLYDCNHSEVPSAGLKEITLYVGEEKYQTKTVQSDHATVFELPAETVLNEQKVYLDKIISATVTDQVGNQSDKTVVTTANSNVKNSNLMIETVNPTITSVLSAEGYIGKNGIVYNNGDTGFNIRVEDKDSGIYQVTASINGTELVRASYPDSKKASENYEINTKDAVIHADTNSYDLTITAIDNAGNEYSQTQKVYKDVTAPEILSIDMEAAGNKEADGSVSYTETDYGYYFVENTRVTIKATDGSKDGDSGVKEIHYYTVEANGTRSGEQTAQADEEGKITFIVPAGFKGQIYACAYDMLDNHEEKYVTPSSLIIETAEQHAREKHLAFSKTAAVSKDTKGNDLYENDVTVQVTVTDDFSGIRSVEWTVESPYDQENNQAGKVEISNQGAFSSGDADGWSQTRTDKNLVTELKKSFAVKNNSNEIKMHVKMTDRAGNTSEDELIFSIDKTKPEIKIEFDNETPDAENTTMFKENRVATITVTERNFEAAAFQADITNTDGAVPELSAWQTNENTQNPDQTTNTATITFAEDGDYTLSFRGQDMAKNEAETVSAEDFTIDKTRPIVTVTYDNNNAVNGNYYAAARTATIQIEEHNFSENRVKITGTASDNGAGISFPQASAFRSNGDVHTATITCGIDGLYSFNVEYTDMAGNTAETYTGEEYYVDTTEPQIEIVGVEDYSANNGDVMPQIVMSDTNFDTNGVHIELIGANQGSVTPEGAYANQGNGQTFTFQNFPKEQSYDDIYTINAALTDMAGNESNATLTFSVNRFGSVYVFDQSLKDIEGTYIQNEIDVRLTEVNVDSLEHEKIKVVVDTNGTTRTLEEGTDYQVQESGGNGQWYQYDYTIDKSLFAGDGRYIVTLYSEDIAGNVNENIDESKEAEISFGVDKTAPVVIPIDIESDTQYPVDVKTANVAINDNLVLDSVEISIGDKKCDYTADGENYQFDIPNSTKKQDFTIKAVDAAGNQTSYVLSGILVTTNTFIRWYNNKPLFVGSIAGAAVVTGGGVGAGIALRSGRIRIKRKRK